MSEFWTIVFVAVGFIVIVLLAVAVDSKSTWDEDLDDTEVRPLLGVVAPKKEEKEEK